MNSRSSRNGLVGLGSELYHCLHSSLYSIHPTSQSENLQAFRTLTHTPTWNAIFTTLCAKFVLPAIRSVDQIPCSLFLLTAIHTICQMKLSEPTKPDSQ